MNDDLIGWACLNCEENFYLDKNDESTNMVGSIKCPYCGEWKHTVLNTIEKN